MSGVDTDALEALRSRLRHAQAIAFMVAQSSERGDTMDAVEGIAAMVEDAGKSLDAIIEQEARRRFPHEPKP